jgi:hypothetical protein
MGTFLNGLIALIIGAFLGAITWWLALGLYFLVFGSTFSMAASLIGAIIAFAVTMYTD